MSWKCHCLSIKGLARRKKWYTWHFSDRAGHCLTRKKPVGTLDYGVLENLAEEYGKNLFQHDLGQWPIFNIQLETKDMSPPGGATSKRLDSLVCSKKCVPFLNQNEKMRTRFCTSSYRFCRTPPTRSRTMLLHTPKWWSDYQWASWGRFSARRSISFLKPQWKKILLGDALPFVLCERETFLPAGDQHAVKMLHR